MPQCQEHGQLERGVTCELPVRQVHTRRPLRGGARPAFGQALACQWQDSIPWPATAGHGMAVARARLMAVFGTQIDALPGTRVPALRLLSSATWRFMLSLRKSGYELVPKNKNRVIHFLSFFLSRKHWADTHLRQPEGR